MKSLYYSLPYAAIKLILASASVSSDFYSCGSFFPAIDECHSVLLRFLQNVAVKNNFPNYQFDTITSSLTYLPWFFLSSITIAEILKHGHTVLSRFTSNEVVLIYLHQPNLFFRRWRFCKLSKKLSPLHHYPLARRVYLVSSSHQIKVVSFSPIVIRWG